MLSAEDGFLKAIEDDPDDDGLRLIYADWLEERGDPRGPAVRARCSQIRRIKEKLEHLRVHGRRHEVFGAQAHQFLLRPCLKEAEIRSFEKKQCVELPEDYRDFLLRVGNGGAGPDNGLASLCVPDDDSRLSEPFLPDEINSRGFPTCYNGYLVIGLKGCGYLNMLVVSGPHRGKVWYDCRDGDGGFEPTGQMFLEWYEAWLDGSLGPNAISKWVKSTGGE
jgi:uncharacterized protein (TIGR02996 family)